MGRFDEALADYSRAIELDPDNDWLYYLKALVFFRLSEISTAEKQLRVAIELARKAMRENDQPGNDSYNLAVYLAAAGRFDETEDQLAAALANYHNQVWISEAIDDLRNLSNVREFNVEQVNRLMGILKQGSTTNP
jgi:tetratricopeptide (TPR) repeat protein